MIEERPGQLWPYAFRFPSLLSELDDALREKGIVLCFAEMKDPVKDKLKRFGLFSRFGEATFHATIGEAVHAYLAANPVEWVDWQDRKS